MKVHTTYLPNQRGGTQDDSTEPDLEIVDCDNADEFLRYLVPVGVEWDTVAATDLFHPPPARWVHRGQRDAKWALTPSAHVGNALQTFVDLSRNTLTASLPTPQRTEEFLAIMAFIENCRRSAAVVPEDGQVLRQIERGVATSSAGAATGARGGWQSGIDFPPPELLSSFAIAQHHGVPTRLLDWTTSPFVAAYFAIAGAAEHAADGSMEGRLAVWSLLRSQIEGFSLALVPGLRFVEAPFDSNSFLRAQQGLFTVVQNVRDSQKIAEEQLVSHEEAISYAWSYAPGMGFPQSRRWVKKVTVAWTEAPRALQLLDRMNINAATIFPGHLGVTQSIRERRFWPSRDLI